MERNAGKQAASTPVLNGQTGVLILGGSAEKKTFREHGKEDHSVDKTESSKQTTERELGR